MECHHWYIPYSNSYLVITRFEVNFKKQHSTQKSIDQVVDVGRRAPFLSGHLVEPSIIDAKMGNLVLLICEQDWSTPQRGDKLDKLFFIVSKVNDVAPEVRSYSFCPRYVDGPGSKN